MVMMQPTQGRPQGQAKDKAAQKKQQRKQAPPPQRPQQERQLTPYEAWDAALVSFDPCGITIAASHSDRRSSLLKLKKSNNDFLI